MNEQSAFNQSIARIAVGAYDGSQDVRKSMMNRVRDLVRKRNEEIPFDEVEDEKDPDDQSFDEKYQDDNLLYLVEEMHDEGKLTADEFDAIQEMLKAAQSAARIENRYQDIMRVTNAEPIVEEWLDHVYGVSHTLTARLIHQFGYCENFSRVSKLWGYSGLAPGQRPKRGEKLDYSPQAKTLAWNVADCMIKQGDRSRYRAEFYDPYKAEQIRRMEHSVCRWCQLPTVEHTSSGGNRNCEEFENSAIEERDLHIRDFDIVGVDVPDDATPPWTRGHADTRARRYLSKKFLKHYWYIARDLKGLDTPDEWVVTHGGHDKVEETFENPAYAARELSPGATAVGD